MLTIFKPYMISYLNQLGKDYKIYLIEQDDDYIFNKSALLNAAVKFALKEFEYDYFAFQDIDMLPVKGLDYPYPDKQDAIYFYLNPGGLLIKREAFLKCNGYNWLLYGWGAEDSDLCWHRLDYYGFSRINWMSQQKGLPNESKSVLLDMERRTDKSQPYGEPVPGLDDLNLYWFNKPGDVVPDDTKITHGVLGFDEDYAKAHMDYNKNQWKVGNSKRNYAISNFFKSLPKPYGYEFCELFGYSQVMIDKLKVVENTDQFCWIRAKRHELIR
jgi:hypothetical protein